MSLHEAGGLPLTGLNTHRLRLAKVNAAVDFTRAGNAGRVRLVMPG